MKKSYFFISALICFLVSTTSMAKTDPKAWEVKYEKQKVFIQNKGQFSIAGSAEISQSEVKYAFDGGSTMIYFTPKGIRYSYLKTWKKEKKDKDHEEQEEMEEMRKGKSHAQIEAEEHKLQYKWDAVDMLFENANANVEIVAEQATPDYHSYMFKDKGITKNINNIKAFKKITYKNIYPNIDIEYTFHPQTGIKYAVILHPGADISVLKMNYSKSLKINDNGEVTIATKFGDMIDHAPLTFYSNNKSETIVSHFVKNNKTISFELGTYDHAKTVVIDPWVQLPAFATNWDCVWECEKDGAGNAYLIGGVTPLQLLKYNSAGVLQWTYNTPYDTSSWLGTFATDLAGNSYVTQGSVAAIIKVNNAAGLVWNNPNPGGIFASTEFWNIAFNCDQSKLVIGGTGGFLPPLAYIYNVDVNTGNITSSQQVATGTLFAIQEVRSITSCRNGKYYFLTHDTIGYINQNFSACGGPGASLFKTNHGYGLGYKCENWRYDNSGIMAIRANRYFVYTQNGAQVQKRSLANGAILATVTIPGGVNNNVFLGGHQVGNSGIDIDSCGNVYVGSTNAVVKYDANLNLLASSPTTFNVYDVTVSYGGEVIAGGSTGNSGTANRTGTIQSFNMGACLPMTLFCCDATICNPASLCTTDPAFTMTAATPGGVWSGTGITNTATGLFNPATAGPGPHTIIYTLACGSDSVVVNVNTCTPLTVCQNANGTLTVTGGTGPYNWQNQVTTTPCVAGLGFCAGFGTVTGPPVTNWVTFTTGVTITPSGTYPIQVIDNSGTLFLINSLAQLPFCSACPPLTISASAQINVNCFGQSTGSFSASSAGGTGPYNYVLMNGVNTIATFNSVAGTQPFAGLPAGTYTLNVTDANACPGTMNVTITQPASALAVAITASTNPACGGTNGSATALASGGSTPFDYVWTGTGGTLQTTNNSAVADVLTGLAAGTYTVTVTDNNGCNATTTVTLTNSGGPTVTISNQINVLCFGGTTGSATATATLGASPYDYVWTSGAGTLQTTNNSAVPDVLNNLGAGTYTVTVTDNGGCVGTATVNITQPTSAPSVAITNTTNAPCGSSTGSTTALASGGSSPYDYVWTGPGGTLQTTNNSTSQDVLNNLAAATYTVTITDNNGCTASATAVVSNTGGGTVNITNQTNVNCFGGNTGNATANTTGGASPYDYVWTGVGGTLQTANNLTVPNTLNGLTAGTYTVTVTDNSGCVSSVIFTITQPTTALSVSLVTSTPATCGNNNGSATVSASGGTVGTGYTYSWAPSGGNNASASGLGANTYTVTATDGNSCATTFLVVVTNSTGPTVSISSQINVNCNGGNTGSATASATGTGNLTYSWSGGGGTNSTANNLAAGTYTVTVTDGSSCTNTAIVTITQGPAIVVTTTSTPSNCATNTGTASAGASGGTGSLTYSWSAPGGSTQMISNLGAGTYTVTVTDSLGCVQTASTSVSTTGGPTANAGNSVVITSGSTTILNGSGSAGATFLWTPSSTLSCNTCPNPTAAPTQTTTYTLTVTLNGCSTSDTVTVFIDILCGELFVPTAFSPNGDNQNDILYVFGNCITNLQFAIFDRWGEKVFETTNQLEGWDGTFNGKKMDPAAFAYYLTATVKGEEVKKHGNITLVK